MARTKRVLTAARTTTNGEDYISKLPESLIVRILSLLEMKDSVKTSALSKSWEKLWTKVDIIVYQYFDTLYRWESIDLRRIDDEPFLSFIDHTLMQCNEHIRCFSLASSAEFSVDVLDKWISHLLDKKLKILKLNVGWRVPDCLFRSSSLTNLELVGVEVSTSPTTVVSLSSLKSLLLKDTRIDDASIDKILIGSPVLENLVICDSTCIHRLNLMSRSLKMLKLWSIRNEGQVFKINAPWLQELEILGKFFFTDFELVNVSSLLKATITFETHNHLGGLNNNWVTEYKHSWIPMVIKLLKSLSYVGELIIASEPLQVLSLSKLSATPSPLFMCKHLSIKTRLWNFDITGIACLLENAPHLETLFLKVVPSYDWKNALPLYQTCYLFQDGNPLLNMPNGKFLHLKNVKIEYCPRAYSPGNHFGGFFDFELVEYILKSAVVLEKLVMCSSRGSSCSDSTCLVRNCSCRYISSLSFRLIIFIMRMTGNKVDGWGFKKNVFTFSNYASLLSRADSSSSSM